MKYNRKIGKYMIPSILHPFLWSYDVEKIDLEKHKDRIIVNVFKFGTPETTDWVKNNYSKEEIKEALRGPIARELDPKSRAYWSLIYDVEIPQGKRDLKI